MSMYPKSVEAFRNNWGPWQALCEALATEIPKPKRRKPPGTPTPTESLRAVIHDAGVGDMSEPEQLAWLRMHRDVGLWVRGSGDTFDWCDAPWMTYRFAQLFGETYESFRSLSAAEREALVERRMAKRRQQHVKVDR